MDTLTFIAEIITALIWPITLVLIILMLRKSILELIPRLARLSYGEFELEFDQELEQIKAQAAKADLPEEDSRPMLRSSAAASSPAPAPAMKVVYPKGVIMEAWQAVEDAVDDMLARRNKKDAARTPQSKARVLQEEGLLDENKLAILGNLWGLRNMAAHEKDFTPTPQQAVEYSQLAERLIKSMEQ